MTENLFSSLKESELNCLAFLKRQGSAATITLMGPTKSTKSTLVTETVPALSNKLLGKNVGITAQTSLIRTLLMLNGRLRESEVLVQGIPHQDKDAMLLQFLTTLRTEIVNAIFKMRDDLEEFHVDLELIKNILDPVNRSYHAYDFAHNHDLTTSLITILDEICKDIIESPEFIEDSVNKLFKERKKEIDEGNKTDKNAKNIQKVQKKDIYEQVIDERFNEKNCNIENLTEWFEKLKLEVFLELDSLWTYKNEDSFILVDEILDDRPVNILIEKIYNKNSACSLVFEEIRYVTSPSTSFKEAFNQNNRNHPGRIVKINILDTVGLTQSSQNEDDIKAVMDQILQRETDSVLFLCASDEQPSVYQTCISLLQDKQMKLAEKPVVICRTKADIVIRNIIAKHWRQNTGENGVPTDEEVYKEYCVRAFDEFNKDYIVANEYGELEIGKNGDYKKVEFLSLAPDYTEKMNEALNNKLHSKRAFEIILNIVTEIDKVYSIDGDRPWLYSKDLKHTPLTLVSNTKHLTKTIATAITAYNTNQRSQYLPYSVSKDVFHGRSVNCFWSKLSYGEGHETRAMYYGNFKLYIKNIIARWLRELIPLNDLINDFSISYDYLSDITDLELETYDFEARLRTLIVQRWWTIVDSISKKLSYDCLQPDLNNCFHYNSWDKGFRESLILMDSKFSSVDYWYGNLEKLVVEEVDLILQKMYIFDEV